MHRVRSHGNAAARSALPVREQTSVNSELEWQTWVDLPHSHLGRRHHPSESAPSKSSPLAGSDERSPTLPQPSIRRGQSLVCIILFPRDPSKFKAGPANKNNFASNSFAEYCSFIQRLKQFCSFPDAPANQRLEFLRNRSIVYCHLPPAFSGTRAGVFHARRRP